MGMIHEPIYVGEVGKPYKLYLRPSEIEDATGSLVSSLDLTAITAAVFKVQKPGQPTQEWAATITEKTSGRLTLVHTIATGDLDISGVYHVYASLTWSGGTYRSATTALEVRREYSLK